MKELKDLSALEIGELVNSGEVSPTKVLDYFFKRIQDLNPKLNAFTYLKKEEAYRRAKALEFQLGTGAYVGPFAGVPFALKDFLPSKEGWSNTHGGVECLRSTDQYSSEFCKAMEGAGGIAIGKTNAPAFGFRGTTDNKLYGPTHNPYDYTRNSGGSSGGSAAAVAAGLVPIAEGGDAGGSIRVPAAWCGCYGFKASFGSIPNVCRPDAWAASHPYCTPGGLTKNVEDAKELFELMRKWDPRDPLSVPRISWDCGNISNLRVGATIGFGLFKDVDSEIQEAVRKTARMFQDAGIQVEWFGGIDGITDKGYSLDYFAELWCKHISVDSMIEFEEAKKRFGFNLIEEAGDQLPEAFVHYYQKAKELTVFDFYEFNKARTLLHDGFSHLFQKYDIILSPVTTCLPVQNSATRGGTVGTGSEPLIGFAETFLYNLIGNPAASCPVGFSREGLPLAIQIAGARFNDDLVLNVSQFLEKIK